MKIGERIVFFYREDVGGIDYSVMDNLFFDSVDGSLVNVVGVLYFLVCFWLEIWKSICLGIFRCCVGFSVDFFV